MPMRWISYYISKKTHQTKYGNKGTKINLRLFQFFGFDLKNHLWMHLIYWAYSSLSLFRYLSCTLPNSKIKLSKKFCIGCPPYCLLFWSRACCHLFLIYPWKTSSFTIGAKPISTPSPFFASWAPCLLPSSKSWDLNPFCSFLSVLLPLPSSPPFCLCSTL